jgi:hypothetical protein
VGFQQHSMFIPAVKQKTFVALNWEVNEFRFSRPFTVSSGQVGLKTRKLRFQPDGKPSGRVGSPQSLALRFKLAPLK